MFSEMEKALRQQMRYKTTSLAVLALAAIFCVFILTKILQWIKFFRTIQNIPHQICLFLGSTEEIVLKIFEKCNRIESTPCNIWLGPKHLLLIDKPEDLQIVLNSPNTLGKPDMYRFFHGTSGEGLFAAPVEKWKNHRRIISPAFNTKLLESFFVVFNKKNQELIEKLQIEVGTEKPFDAWEYIYQNSLTIILETTMGFDEASNGKEKLEFEKALEIAVAAESVRAYKPWLHPDIIFFIYSYITGLNESYKIMHKLPRQVIKHKKEKRDEEKRASLTEMSTKKDKFSRTFLDILLELNEEGANFSDDDIRDETVTMMIGGSETSALTISFALLMLAMHPEVQEKVYREVTEIIGIEDRFIELHDVQKLTYLEQCIKETLRLFPVGALFLRTSKYPTVLSDGFVIPANVDIVIPPAKVHRNPAIYPNPLIWNPNNFTLEEINKRHKYSFLPFSMGPRACIGSKYAMLSMKVTISKIIQNYKLETDVTLNDIQLKVDLLLRSANGYKIKLFTRK